MGLLDFVFPKRCVNCRKFGEYICADCFAKISFDPPLICLVCNKAAILGVTHPLCKKRDTIDGSFASLVYKGVVKKLIYQFKYQPYLSDLSSTLSELFYEGVIQQEQFHRLVTFESIFVPIPLHPDKLRQRGYNHAELLGKALGRRVGIRVIAGLKRVKKTTVQSALNRDERAMNIREAFAVNEKHLPQLQGKQIFLIDDITTTGATMLEAAKVLKKAGVEKVWGIALAHGQ